MAKVIPIRDPFEIWLQIVQDGLLPKNNKCCTLCGSEKIKKKDFNSPKALKEFQSFSGFCQTCQDNIQLSLDDPDIECF